MCAYARPRSSSACTSSRRAACASRRRSSAEAREAAARGARADSATRRSRSTLAQAREIGFEPPGLARGVDRVRQATNLALGSHHSAVPRGDLRGGARVRGGGDVHRRGRTRRRRFGSVGARDTRRRPGRTAPDDARWNTNRRRRARAPRGRGRSRSRARRKTRVFEIARGVAEDASALATNRRHLARREDGDRAPAPLSKSPPPPPPARRDFGRRDSISERSNGVGSDAARAIAGRCDGPSARSAGLDAADDDEGEGTRSGSMPLARRTARWTISRLSRMRRRGRGGHRVLYTPGAAGDALVFKRGLACRHLERGRHRRDRFGKTPRRCQIERGGGGRRPEERKEVEEGGTRTSRRVVREGLT